MNLRIDKHPILDFKREKKVQMSVNGNIVVGYEGETIAAALYASGIRVYSHSVRYNRPRGFFCGIGKCSSCLMRVNGVPHIRTCLTFAKEGMKVEYERGYGDPPTQSEMNYDRAKIDADLAVVGGGPAGLSAALTAESLGINSIIIDENPKPGGQLIKQTHKFFGSKSTYAGVRGVEIASILLKKLRETNVKYLTNASAVGLYEGKRHLLTAVQENRKLLEINAKKIIVATGARENMLLFQNNDLPGIYGAGGVQTLMNVYGVRPGDNALIVGAGNVGLIVGYQLIQAGVNVKMVVEAMSRIGGYLVHASKLKRLGVPILTQYTVKGAKGKDYLEGVTIVKVDENWQPIEGTEEEVKVDLMCIAVGLTPSSELLLQAGCRQAYIPELGGQVAIHNENLKTTVDDLYVAGDTSGIEEANTAMTEGKLAAANVALEYGKNTATSEKIIEESFKELQALRASPFGLGTLRGKKRIWDIWRQTYELRKNRNVDS